MLDEKWKALNKSEKDFCTELNLKPTSYCNLKKQLQIESIKNKLVTKAFVENMAKGTTSQTVRHQVPLVYEFLIKANMINKQLS